MKKIALIFFGIIFAAAFVGCKKEAPVTPERTTLPVKFTYTAYGNIHDTADIYYSFGGDTVRTLVIGGQWSISADAPIGKIAYARAVGRVHGFNTKIEICIVDKSSVAHTVAHSSPCNMDKSISLEIKDYGDYSYHP